MIFDWHDPDVSFSSAPYVLKDGEGKVIDLPIFWLNTVTGKARAFVRDAAGKSFETTILGDDLVRYTYFLVPPLRVFDKNGYDIFEWGLPKNDIFTGGADEAVIVVGKQI